ncbi:TRM11 family SAM-dependent methyltransferase [Plantactinospora sp. WMMB782]|uniref:TRM11 family SAM-dependent methyltransferase n=1 Tax=Plantactinospora sp. WMMB782 TaxID=3404121 RepID=UPI003B93BE80
MGTDSPDSVARARRGGGKRDRRGAAPKTQGGARQRARRSGPDPQEQPRPGVTRMFAAVVPGLAALVARDLRRLPGITVTQLGFDGRSDLVLFDVERGHRDALWSLRTVEDLFVEVGQAVRAGGDRPRWIAERLWRPERVEKALSVWSAEVRPLAGSMTFRVISRVLQEKSFLRTDLRRAITEAVAAGRPKWRFADPSQLEVWVSEYQPGRLVAGLRLSDASLRQHAGREVERSGALRPTVAAQMVLLAGQPDGVLLDPCCGSGTILSEAGATGWRQVMGGDIDPAAVEIARSNAPTADVRQHDVRHLDLPDAAVAAVVSNLPFGRQFDVEGSMSAWLTAALAEMARVTRPGGRVVLLAPDIPGHAIPARLRPHDRRELRLLGTRTTLWVFERLTDR